MPQMSPMDWLFWMIYFFLMYFMFLLNLYYNLKLNFNNFNMNLMKMNFSNKWY